MILILSNRYDDSTFDVIKYIRAPYKIITEEFFIYEFTTYISKNENYIKYGNINFNDIKLIWYRRTSFSFDILNHIDNKFKNFGFSELNKYKLYLLSQFYERRIITSIDQELNLLKLDVLKKAISFNIDVPETLVTSSKNELIEFLNIFKYVISKPISNVTYLDLLPEDMFLGTLEVTKNDLDKLNDYFFPSLFQRKVKCTFEIRSFYLDGKFFSMAQFRPYGLYEIDIRSYKREVRRVRFQLPKALETKLILLLQNLGLECASLDLLKGDDDVIYLLEINPTGQFGYLSSSCGYNIEEEIGNYITRKYYENR